MAFNNLQNTSLPDAIKHVEIVDVRAEIPVNPNYSWRQLKGTRDMSKVTVIYVHHDGMAKSSTSKYSDMQLISNIAKSHIRSTNNLPKGDNFPYTMYVRSGKAYITNDLDYLTFGVASQNENSVHISVGGNYAGVDTLTDEDRTALYAGILWLRANLSAWKTVLGHKEAPGAKTACPGTILDGLRSDLATLYPLADKPPIDAEISVKVEAVKARINDLYKTSTTAGKYASIAQQYLTNIYEVMKKEGIL